MLLALHHLRGSVTSGLQHEVVLLSISVLWSLCFLSSKQHTGLKNLLKRLDYSSNPVMFSFTFFSVFKPLRSFKPWHFSQWIWSCGVVSISWFHLHTVSKLPSSPHPDFFFKCDIQKGFFLWKILRMLLHLTRKKQFSQVNIHTQTAKMIWTLAEDI